MKKVGVIGRCPVCDRQMFITGQWGITHHHLFFPKKNYAENDNIKLTICQECHHEFNETVKNCGNLTKRDCLVLFVRFCKSKGKNAYAIYQQLKGVSVV